MNTPTPPTDKDPMIASLLEQIEVLMAQNAALTARVGNNTARQIVDGYARRWTIEPSFCDTKDIRFGMGLSLLRTSRPDRRDRLLLLNAFAMHLLTMLGTAGEELGMDRHLKSNTSKARTHSLYGWPAPPSAAADSMLVQPR